MKALYTLARATYRRVLRQERREAEQYRGSPAASLRSLPAAPGGLTATQEMLQGLGPRLAAAVLARPATQDELRIPRGPKATAIFTRGRMDLNKRVALRRAIRANQEHDRGQA